MATNDALDRFDIVAYFPVHKCDYYFMRFATDAAKTVMALGNTLGDVYIWNLQTDNPANIQPEILKHPKRTGVARDVSLSRNGRDLVICCDDGTIWYYQRQ